MRILIVSIKWTGYRKHVGLDSLSELVAEGETDTDAKQGEGARYFCCLVDPHIVPIHTAWESLRTSSNYYATY